MKKDKAKSSKGSSKFEERMAKAATDQRAREQASGGGLSNKISIKNRRFTFGGENLGREIEVAVVDFTHVNAFYKGEYKEGAPEAPNCFALSEDGEDITPHENVKKPEHDACEGCPQNEWGSAKQGRGKACKQKRRLGLISLDDIKKAKEVGEANFAILEIPPTSVKEFAAYLDELKDKTKRPLHAVTTKISFDPDETYAKPVFALGEKLDEDVVEALEERIEEIREELMTPYAANASDDKKKSKKKGKKDDDDDEDDEDEEEDEKPKKKVKRKEKDDEDEEDDEEDEEDDEDDDEDDRKSSKRKGKRKPSRNDDDDDDDDEEDDDDDEEDEDDEDSDDEDEDDKPKKRKRSKFGK